MMKQIISPFLIITATCMLYVQSVQELSGDVTSKKYSSKGLYAGWDGFQNVSGHYVYINNEILARWERAEEACNVLNMSLISLEGQEKHDVITDYLVSNNFGLFDYWSSGRKVEDAFLWEGSGQAFNFTSWHEGQPNGGSTDVCVDFIASFGWYDDSCNDLNLYICE